MTDTDVDQRLPTRAPSEMDRPRRFGTARRYVKDARLYTTWQAHPGMLVITTAEVSNLDDATFPLLT